MAADRVPPVAVAEHLAQPVDLEQPGGRAEHVTDRDRAAQHRGRVLAHRVAVSPTSSSYQARICGQSVSAALAASSCSAAMAASTWYRPGRSAASAPCRTRTPSAISRVSQRLRSCWSSVTMRPSPSTRAGQPGVVQQHQREQPAHLRLRGRQHELAGQPDRLARPGRPGPRARSCRRGRGRAAPPRRRRAGPGGARAAPRLARLIRCAIVASGTKKASAISRVVSPPTARSVSATWEAGDEVGLAQRNSRNSVSSACSVGPGSRLGVVDLLAPPPGGLAAAGVDQPPGRHRREPRPRVTRRVLGPGAQRLDQRLLQRVLRGGEVLAAPHQPREHLRDEGPQHALVHPSRRCVGHAGQSSEGACHMICRTSIHS